MVGAVAILGMPAFIDISRGKRDRSCRAVICAKAASGGAAAFGPECVKTLNE
jgi:hypothetical protein